VPRRINQICNRLMLLGAVEQRGRIDRAMLGQVLEELELDGTMQLKKITPQPVIDVAPQPAHAAQPVAFDAAAMAQLQSLLAQRDAQIAELQHAVIELASEGDSDPVRRALEDERLVALEARFASLEAKMLEQEQTIRHTLTMLIEWVEADGAGRAAA
jgi:uncharacterized coiled-coil protein SlyX